jgi:isoquinoline 1-oxidoreductase subunit alpha
MPLFWLLRERLGLNCAKFCTKSERGAGLRGACTVQIDGAAVRSCVSTLGDAARKTS